MVSELTNHTTPDDKRLAIRQFIFGQTWDDKDFKQLINQHGHTSASLLEEAMSNRKDELIKLDQQIALRMKTLMQLQQSYEALVNRSIMHDASNCKTHCSSAILWQLMCKRSSK